MEAFFDGFVAQNVIDLFQKGRPLPVRYPIEKRLRLLRRIDLTANGMRGTQLIRANPPELILEKRFPNSGILILELRRLGHHHIGHVGGEGFIQPHVVPPFHGHQISEPHVGQLVQDGVCKF